ncbi:hypothetical protein MJI46_34805, partial [Salmonella enterica subsp. enterica serovar Cerro]|nr:hypothetical protein [Salmonella enterica subsp. enterica serovar Cerro]
GIDEIFQFVTAALVFGQPSVQVSIYPFRMTDANMQRHKYSYYTFNDGPLSGLTLGTGGRFIGSSYGDPANSFKVGSAAVMDAV